jgi:hypothetical protein
MRSKFRIAGHMDYLGKLRGDVKRWLFGQGAVSNVTRREYELMKGSRAVKRELDPLRTCKPGCKAKNECFAAANFASCLSRPAKDNFAALITTSE